MGVESLMASFFFGLLGTAMFVFGKKSGRVVPLVCGIVLMVLPALMPSVLAMTLACSLVAAVPFVLSV